MTSTKQVHAGLNSGQPHQGTMCCHLATVPNDAKFHLKFDYELASLKVMHAPGRLTCGLEAMYSPIQVRARQAVKSLKNPARGPGCATRAVGMHMP
jgi:hypothetical protein